MSRIATIFSFRRHARRARAGLSWIGLSGVLSAAVVTPLVAWYAIPADGLSFSSEDETSGPLMEKVSRGVFVHELNERGDVESGSTIDVRCEVQSRGGGGVAILEIAPEGTKVKAGDIIGKLDSAALEAEYAQQQIICNTSAAGLIQFRTTYETAIIAKQEYLEGTYKQEEQLIQAELFVAEENLRRAEEYANYSAKLAARNFVTAVTLEADRFAVEKAKKDVETAKTKLRVLQDFAKAKMLKSLDAAIKTAEAQLKAQESSHAIDIDKLALIKAQIDKCTLRAPQDGEVTYPTPQDYRDSSEVIIKEGTIVRERQTIIRLPDPKQMQVNAKVNESKIRLLKIGMPATVKIESLDGEELTGTVTKVYAYANRSRWSASSVKDFSVIIDIHNPPLGLRTGSSAEVKIRVNQSPDELMVPVMAVLEHGGHYFCVQPDGDSFAARQVELGATNDEQVVITSGLKENDLVVSNPRAYLDELKLPELPAKVFDAKEMIAGKQPLGGGASGTSSSPPAAKPSVGAPDNAAVAGAGAAGSGDRVGGMLQRMDKNGDGRLDKDELPPQMADRFGAADKNTDGFLDADEISNMPRGGGRRPSEAGGAPAGAGAVGGGAGL